MIDVIPPGAPGGHVATAADERHRGSLSVRVNQAWSAAMSCRRVPKIPRRRGHPVRYRRDFDKKPRDHRALA
jgi:hypothetical protein